MCVFKKDRERGFFKSFATAVALLAGVWALSDLSRGRLDEGAVKLIWFVSVIVNYVLGYMTAAIKPIPKCQLPHLPEAAKISQNEHLEVNQPDEIKDGDQ